MFFFLTYITSSTLPSFLYPLPWNRNDLVTRFVIGKRPAGIWEEEEEVEEENSIDRVPFFLLLL